MSKTTSMILGAALLAAGSLRAAPAAAAGACVSPKVREALADCSAASPGAPTPPADLLAAAKQLQSRASIGMLPVGKSRSKVRPAALLPRELDDAETKADGAFRRFLCDDKPAPGDAAARAESAEIAYARARLHFSANRFEDAAILFRDIALHRADTPVGIYASQLYLESLNILANAGSEGSTGCYDDMATDVPTFIGLYCADGKDRVNAEACDVMTRIQRDILRLQAEQKIKEAERERAHGAESTSGFAEYEAGGAMYLQIWERYGKAACEARTAGCERMEEVLYNAARAYQAARDIDRSIAVRMVLVDPRYHLDATELGKKAVYEIGGCYQATAFYDEAATWYERYAAMNPAADKSPEALSDATVIRLGLGQDDKAIKNADAFNKLYGSKKPAQTATIAFAIGAHYVDRAAFAQARKRLTGAMGQIDRNGPIDVQIQAHALLGRTAVALHEDPLAAAEYGKVRALFSDPASVVRRLTEGYDGSADRKVAKVLTVEGEAMFFFAEEKRRAADAIELPIYQGTGRREDVLAYTTGPLATWWKQRRAAIDEAEKAYVAVLAIQPSPPPKWVVASAARAARLHGRLAAQLLSAPIPKSWKAQGPSPWGPTWEQIRAEFRRGLAEASEPELGRAKGAYRMCLDLSVRYQYFDQHTRACAAWLSSHFPAEFPAIDEIVDRPSHRYSAIERELPVGGIKVDP